MPKQHVKKSSIIAPTLPVILEKQDSEEDPGSADIIPKSKFSVPLPDFATDDTIKIELVVPKN